MSLENSSGVVALRSAIAALFRLSSPPPAGPLKRARPADRSCSFLCHSFSRCSLSPESAPGRNIARPRLRAREVGQFCLFIAARRASLKREPLDELALSSRPLLPSSLLLSCLLVFARWARTTVIITCGYACASRGTSGGGDGGFVTRLLMIFGFLLFGFVIVDRRCMVAGVRFGTAQRVKTALHEEYCYNDQSLCL